MQQGGSQYGVPPIDMTSQFTSSSGGSAAAARTQLLRTSAGTGQLQQQQQQQAALPAEVASPISSRLPPPQQTVGHAAGPNYEELVTEGVPGGGFGDEDAFAAVAGEVERGGALGNRWPRQETLALLKIRSDLDAAFRDATLKGPLWEDVSRKLAELGYCRSAKKCKEKFENVQKYYKRTKEGRAGRQDGKSYRFFSQLEALHSSAAAPSPVSMASPSPIGPAVPSSRAPPQAATPISAISPPPLTDPPATTRVTMGHFAGGGISSSAAAAGIGFSSNTSSSSSDDSDDETEEGVRGAQETSRKRKRSEGGTSGGSSCRKMMPFFEGLMKQVMERQEQMQQQFLETIEKREQDRMIREEAWRRQEMTRLAREHEIMAQERAMAANRDAAIIAFLQKVTGQSIQLPTLPIVTPPPPQPSPQPPPPTPQQQHRPPPPPPQPTPSVTPQDPQVQKSPPQQRAVAAPALSADLVTLPEQQEITPASGRYEGAASSSRWPKSEIDDLIKLRSGLETKYQEAGPKGPLWEEISAEMQKLGYNRSAKRCKEKWENINKYFKKVKESNKKRPEDAKTCPYFHQLDALYRKKNPNSATSAASGAGSSSSSKEQQETPKPLEPATAAPPQSQPPTNAEEGKNGGNEVQIPTSNGGLPPSFFEGANTSKKPEDIMKEMMNRQQHQALIDEYEKLDEGDSDNMDQDYDEDDDEDDEDRKLQYKIQLQRQNGGGNTTTASANNPSGKPATTSAGSFLAMVQ